MYSFHPSPDVRGGVSSGGLLEHVQSFLACPSCKGTLIFRESDCTCDSCGHAFVMVDETYRLRMDPITDEEIQYKKGLRVWIRGQPAAYRLAKLFSPIFSRYPHPKRIFGQQATLGDIILDIGSGNQRNHPSFVNVDILANDEVDIIADARELPFKDSSIDGIVSIVSLEHIPRSDLALDEFSRVLKQGGRSFIVVPFMQPLHASPSDFKRWTIAGLTEDLDRVGIDVVRSGIAAGPASTMAWMTAEFLSLVLSLGIRRVRNAISLPLQVLCSPIKWFDILLARMPGAEVLASSIWVEAIRRSDETSPDGVA